ncbi:isoquinoline 1-oxidoreductase beta subunit [Haloferula luteola]|uniref:Isoquinoline 1-oxidoreductase beta subunit n=1 Tax=Haloferula luteola TaxID=595692 RepID=A0A840V347_9BACT|nr:molybdopterin cofactor-binding domain-containing protein [Haloferula luteola]MBB5352412.1 isoquinoline 1-oxidoreductase beta subunit [Haloferula luteola]
MNTLDRRSFFKVSALAGGGFFLVSGLRAETEPELRDFSPSAFIRLTPDGRVTIMAHKPEIGQGVKTSLPMIVAEEMEVPWEMVTVEQAPINPAYGGQTAGGSTSVPSSYERLRKLGAVAKTMLIAAAAEAWKVSPTECHAEAGEVVHGASGRKRSYGELALSAARQPVPAEDSVVLKDPKDFKILGRRIGGVDNRAIVTGQPLFGLDQVQPGMLHACFLRCPVSGGKVKSANLAEVAALPGVHKVFEVEGSGDRYGLYPGIAVVADSTWRAIKALRALKVEWDDGGHGEESSAAHAARATELMKGAGAARLSERGQPEFSEGSLDVVYSYPHLAHNTLEPQNCTAVFRNGEFEFWAPTQNGGSAIDAVARQFGVPKENVKIHLTRIGGGFGRRLMVDSMVECAAIARQIEGIPVKLTWTREQDLAQDYYRPGAWHRFRGAVDVEGKLSSWADHFVTFGLHSDQRPGNGAGIGGDEFPAHFVPNFQLEQTVMPSNLPLGWWRAPGSCGLAFAIQGFLDEMAHAAGKDPLDFKLELLGDQEEVHGYHVLRMKGALRAAAEKAGWGRSLPKGSGQGIAFHYSHRGYVAVVAEVTVSPDGKLSVDRLIAGVDVGPVLNPSGAENQVHGSMLDGLSAAWFQQVKIEAGSVANASFAAYPVLRMPDAARVESVFVNSPFSPTGLGEPALPPTAPAVCNAIFAATGKRVRDLPLQGQDLRWS